MRGSKSRPYHHWTAQALVDALNSDFTSEKPQLSADILYQEKYAIEIIRRLDSRDPEIESFSQSRELYLKLGSAFLASKDNNDLVQICFTRCLYDYTLSDACTPAQQVMCYLALGIESAGKEKLEDAENYYQKSISQCEILRQTDPSVYNSFLANIHKHSGIMYLNRRDYFKAALHFTTALGHADHAGFLAPLLKSYLGFTLLHEGNRVDALAYQKAATVDYSSKKTVLNQCVDWETHLYHTAIAHDYIRAVIGKSRKIPLVTEGHAQHGSAKRYEIIGKYYYELFKSNSNRTHEENIHRLEAAKQYLLSARDIILLSSLPDKDKIDEINKILADLSHIPLLQLGQMLFGRKPIEHAVEIAFNTQPKHRDPFANSPS